MEFVGKIKNISLDYETGDGLIAVSCKKTVLNKAEKLKDGNLSITIKKKRNKRSNDANAYAWVLMQKIAEAIDSDKWSVYLEMLVKYSRVFDFVIVKPEAVQRIMEAWRTCVDFGEVEINGQKGHQLQVFYGSSTFDSKEMAVFIDGIVGECEQLEINTMPPQEIERLVKLWNH